MRAVSSIDAVTTRRLSGLNAAETTAHLWPVRVQTSLPVSASRTSAVPSGYMPNAVATSLLSGLNSADSGVTKAYFPSRYGCHQDAMSFPSAGSHRRATGTDFFQSTLDTFPGNSL